MTVVSESVNAREAAAFISSSLYKNPLWLSTAVTIRLM